MGTGAYNEKTGRAIMDKNPVISVVVPCHNEADCIGAFIERLRRVFADLPDYELELVFVNDGSTDNTLEILEQRLEKDPEIVIVDLSRNFGKEAALSAGLQQASGDAAIPMDADLQDPPELVPQMLQKWREGYDVVLAHRQSRAEDSLAKRLSARWFYRLHNLFSQPGLPENVGDFRLLDRRVINALQMLPENCRFMKGIFAWLGFRTASIDYDRPARIAGRSKFPAWKLWNFAMEGLTSFSTAPLRVWIYIGAFFALLAFVHASIIFWRTIFFGVDLPGYASLLVAITFFSGLQLMGIGIIGEYLGRTYLEAKRRPIFIIRKVYRGEK